MELIDRILDDDNINAAIHAVRSNKGAPGIDKMSVGVLKSYFAEHGRKSSNKSVRRSISRNR